MTSSVFTQIRVSHPSSAGVATITLSREARLNAFTVTMCSELEDAFTALSSDPNTKVIILSGDGRVFCAGADLAGLAAGGEPEDDHRDEGGRVALAIHRCPKPTLALVHGAAVGVGATMLLPCTFRVAVAGTKISYPFVKRGLVMEGISSYFLPRLVGFGKAQEILVSGETYVAGDATAPTEGLWSIVLNTKEEAERWVNKKAEELAGNSATSMTAVRRLLWADDDEFQGLWGGQGEIMGRHILESRLLAGLRSGYDVVEGTKAFLQKRRPNFGSTRDILTAPLRKLRNDGPPKNEKPKL